MILELLYTDKVKIFNSSLQKEYVICNSYNRINSVTSNTSYQSFEYLLGDIASELNHYLYIGTSDNGPAQIMSITSLYIE